MSNAKDGLVVNIHSIQDVFSKRLVVPAYQRPYKWRSDRSLTEGNPVLQLLEDLRLHFDKGQHYRLGTVVLHANDGNQEIVDGQQRLTTLALLLYALDGRFADKSIANLKDVKRFLDNKVAHSISQKNIKNNYEFIRRWLECAGLNEEKFVRYILQNCEMMCVILTDLDEAFQFFDSQNARGKMLEPYDLLKAFHLRAMPSENVDIRGYVEQWERAASDGLGAKSYLKLVISETLYRLRQWQRGASAHEFTARELSLFKGESQDKEYPYLRVVKAGWAMYQAKRANPLLYSDDFADPPFQIGQPLLNGQLFFEYIEHYCRQYQKLFGERGVLDSMIVKMDGQEKPLLPELSYKGSHRAGDRYIRNLFECSILFYFDKFGEEGLKVAVLRALKWAYRLRLMHQRVDWSSVEREAVDKAGFLSWIRLVQTPLEVAQFVVPKYETRKANESAVEALMKAEIGNA